MAGLITTVHRDDAELHLSDDTIGTFGPTDKRALATHHVAMASVTQSSGGRAPRLRLLASEGSPALLTHKQPRPSASDGRPALRLVDDTVPLLIAGGDASRRAVLLDELAQTMPGGTRFQEVSKFTEVLEHAPRSRIVILSGPLEDISVESLTRVLRHRHPKLPVVSLDTSEPLDS